MKCWLMGVLCLLLVACGGEQNLPPTNAPIIPPTRTLTPIPSNTSRPYQTLAATADLSLPTWTASPSSSPLPSRTLAPSFTPRPSATPTILPRTGLMEMSDGAVLLVAAEDFAIALENTQFKPEVRIEAPFMSLAFTLPNEFLGKDSQIQAQVSPRWEAGQLALELVRYDFEGALVTEEQVVQALRAMTPFFNQFILEFDPTREWVTLDVLQGFLRLSTGATN